MEERVNGLIDTIVELRQERDEAKRMWLSAYRRAEKAEAELTAIKKVSSDTSDCIAEVVNKIAEG